MSDSRRIHNFLNNTEMTRKEFLAFLGLFIITIFGIVEIIKRLESTMAASPYVRGEAESGVLGGTATIVADSTASGGQALRFGSTTSKAMVYVGGWVNDMTQIAPALTSRGADPTKSVGMVFTYGTGWSSIGPNQISLANELSGFPGIRCLAAAMTDGGIFPTSTTNGSGDSALTATANACATYGVKFIRLGWEFNNGGGNSPGGLPPYSNYTPAQFIACFQHIVSVMRAANPNLKFMYNPNGGGNDATVLAKYYPGDAYTDLVCLDLYDSISGMGPTAPAFTAYEQTPITTTALTQFAIAHKKDIAIPEWGMIQFAQQGWNGSGDNPQWVTDSLNWAYNNAAQGINTYMMAWMDGYPTSDNSKWGLNQFPNSWARLKTDITAGRAAGLIA